MKAAITNFLNPSQIASRLRDLGPYFLIELIVPGGSVFALLLWWYQHRHDAKPLRFPCKAA
jgi:hypothetical protein